jgi:DNA ligase-1
MVKFNDKTSQQLKISEPPINWWASEKWDGIRALWDGEKMISRGSGVGKPKVYTYIPEWFKRSLPPSIPLDGEIWIGRGLFQKTSRLSTLKPGKSYSQEQIDNIWTGLEDPQVIFKVFDIPNDPRPFEERMKLLQTIVKDQKECWKKLDYRNKKTFPIQFTEQVKIKSMEQLVSLYKKMTSEGAEGIMLRAPGSQYETKRSKYMLKYKIKEDAECIVRDYTLGEGRLKGLLGSLKCEIIQDSKASGIFTQIGTGFTDSQRTNYNKKGYSEYVPIGSIVSFSYMEMTDDGVPRHPVYRGVRDDIEAPKQKVSIAHVKQILNKII